MKLGDLVKVDWVDPNLFKSDVGVVVDTKLEQDVVEVITTSGLRAWLSVFDLKVVCDAN